MGARIPSAETIARMASCTPKAISREDGKVVEYELEGLPRYTFDRLGKPRIDFVAKILEVNRFFFLNKVHSMIDFESSGNIAIVASQTWNFDRKFYKTLAVGAPLSFHFMLGEISDKLICEDADIYEKTTGSILIRSSRRLAFVNDSGHLQPFPKHFISKLAEKGYKHTILPRVKQPAPPVDCYVYHVTTAASDMDHLYHVNQASYVRYCLDAAYEAGMDGKLPQFTKDIAEYDVKEAAMAYRAQTVAGDNLEVKVWEDQLEPRTLHFLTSKHGNTVNIATIKYYGEYSKI